MSITINQLENTLDGWRQRTNDKWQAICPAHEDVEPSLSIKKNDKGQVLLFCHAGCSYDEIVNRIITPGTNGHLNGNGVAKKKKKRKRKGPPVSRRLVATYNYHDKDGTILFHKLRYTPKHFMMKRPSGEWGLGDVTPVLYRLHEVVKVKRGDRLFIVEGEMDVDRLVSLGLVATCNFDGSSKAKYRPKWREEYNQYLTGKEIVLIPDNDGPGRAHMDHIARQLIKLDVSCKVIDLPVDDKEDISDWLDKGHTIAELKKIVDDSPYITATAGKPTLNIKDPRTIDFTNGLTEYLGYSFRLNELDDSIEVDEKQITDVTAAIIRNKMRDIELTAPKRIEDAYMQLSHRNRYHPIREYLNSLEWDGKDYISYFVNHHLTETTGLGEVAFKRFLIGAVAKIYDNRQNFMLVIDGPQNAGKSFMIRWLCPLPRFFIEGAIKPDDKDFMIRLCTKMLWEVSELQATTRKADREALKGFITTEEVTVRKSYGRYQITKPALCSLIGTINEDGAGFLSDPTGNRRFVVINVTNIDWNYTQLDPSLLWAQAVGMYRAGEPWQLTPDEAKKRDAINAQYEMTSPLADFFYASYQIVNNSEESSTAHNIIKRLETNGLRGNQKASLNELSRLMKRTGVKKIRARKDGSRVTAYQGVLPLWEEIGGKSG